MNEITIKEALKFGKHVFDILLNLWIKMWPSFVAVLIALYIDSLRFPRFIIYPEPHEIINRYNGRGRWKFVRLIILNKKMPLLLRWLPRQVAQGCKASLEFFNEEGQSLFKMHGRWANTPEIPHVARGSRIERTLYPDPVSIWSGEEQPLDCVVQNEEESVAYGWNNEAYFNNWRTPNYRLSTGHYKVKISIIAQNGSSMDKEVGLDVNDNFELTKLS